MTRQQQNALNRADDAPRCHHFHLDGRQCASPALTGRRLCYFHQRALRPKLPDYKLPLLEDAASVQFGLVQVVRALEDKAYDPKTSALLLYALQTASANLRRVQEERDWERRELERQSQPQPIRHESFAEIMIRGLGLREPDPPARPEAPAGDSWPPESSEAPFDSENLDSPGDARPPERRGPTSAPRSNEGGHRGRGSA